MTDKDRRAFLQKSLAAGTVAASGVSLGNIAYGMSGHGQLEVAAIRFGTMADVGDAGASKLGNKVLEVAGPLKTTIMLLREGNQEVCIICIDFLLSRPLAYFKKIVSQELGIAAGNVVMFSSHNHSDAPTGGFTGVNDQDYRDRLISSEESPLTPFGERLFKELRDSARRLRRMLEPVSVWYAEGSEGRITYNRKGRRADGSTYFMREEDRGLVGDDYNGDIDRQAPVVVFKNKHNKPVAALVQFTGHPVTSYKPEAPVVFGEWSQTATDIVGRELAEGGEPIPVGFLQGCAGDVNSKEMFSGGVERSRLFGKMLGESYVKALNDLQPSARSGLMYAAEAVPVPCGPLPDVRTLQLEIDEMNDFIRRADAGDQKTLSCVGLNFPHALSPEYRGALVKSVLPWSEWALDIRKTGREDTIMKALDLPIYVIGLGDVGIVGLQCEPFQGIGRRLRELSPLPLTIPCGYANGSHGYVTDSANTGDLEYMSSYYRYTRFRPQFARPAGDVLADRGAQILAKG